MAERILITGARAPAALHLAWALRSTGHAVFLADSLRHPIGAATGHAQAYLRFAPPVQNFEGFRRDLTSICHDHQITLILPTCEEVFWLAQIAGDLPRPARLFAPSPKVLRAAHDKAAFIATCAGFWPHLPQTHLLRSGADLLPHLPDAGNLVFKPVFSRFASRILIRPDPSQLRKLRPSDTDPWVAQRFVAGREICAYAIAQAGDVQAIAVYHPKYRAGTGAGIYFQPVDPAPALAFVQAYCNATRWSGQISFDLIEGDAGLTPIECNPRATSGLHLLRDAQALTNALLTRSTQPQLISADTKPQCVKLAMWVYAASPNRHRMSQFRTDLRAASEAMAWPDGSHVTLSAQARAVAEIAGIAIRTWQTLQQAATTDIEWNGQKP